MGVRLSFDFEGERQVNRTLENMRVGALDASPAFDAIGDSLRLAEAKQFNSEGAYASGGWAPLSTNYERWKARHHPGKPIMELSGATREALTRRPFGIDVVERKFGLFGTGLPYPRYHQEGAGNLPRRPVLDIPESLRRRWVKILQRWLVENRT